MMSFCMDMALAVTTFPATSILSMSRVTAFISLLFSWHASVASVMPVEGGIRRDDVRAASVRQHGAAQRLAVNADYLHAGFVHGQSGLIVLGELLHPPGHAQFVYPLLDAAQRRLRGHSVPEHAHFTESVQVVRAELYYLGTHGMPRGAAENHQHYDIRQTVADVPFVRPAEIGDGRGEIYQFFQNAATEFGIIL